MVLEDSIWESAWETAQTRFVHMAFITIPIIFAFQLMCAIESPTWDYWFLFLASKQLSKNVHELCASRISHFCSCHKALDLDLVVGELLSCRTCRGGGVMPSFVHVCIHFVVENLPLINGAKSIAFVVRIWCRSPLKVEDDEVLDKLDPDVLNKPKKRVYGPRPEAVRKRISRTLKVCTPSSSLLEIPH